MKQRMYRKGRRLSTVGAIKRILAQEYVMLGDKPMHFGWMQSMPLGTVAWQARCGRLFAAIKNEENK